MRVRAMSSTGDYTFGQSAANFLVNNSAAVAQLIGTTLRLMQGEWFLDTRVGVPYNTKILGVRTKATCDAAIKKAILGVQGVKSITSYQSFVPQGTRLLNVQAEVLTVFGPVPVNNPFGQSNQPAPLPFGGP